MQKDDNNSDDLLNVSITVEERRYLMGLLMKTMNHYALHLNSKRGRYHDWEKTENHANHAWLLYQRLKNAKTYREAKL